MIDKSINDSCQDCKSRKSTEWSVLCESGLTSIDKAKRMVEYEPGETLYSQGDTGAGIYCIKSGLIGIRRVDSNGNSVLIRLASEGTTVGYRTFFTRQQHNSSAEVLMPSLVCYIARPQVELMLKANPRLGEHFLQHFIDDAIETEKDYVRSMTMGMKSRFLHLIMVFYEQYGYTDTDGAAKLELPVRRGELAELVGVRPESISRLIDKLQADKVMTFEGRSVHIGDISQVLHLMGASV